MLGGPLLRLINGLLYIICIEKIGERERWIIIQKYARYKRYLND